MSRASGRKNLPRTPQVEPGSPEGREIGLSARQDPAGSPIPGLTGNIANYETTRQKVPTGEPFDEFRGMMAHGVPHEEHTTEERATAERGGPNVASRKTPAVHAEPHEPPLAVPVYIVEQGSGSQLRVATARHIIVPSMNSGDPVRVVGRDPKRAKLRLMNTDANTNLRIAYNLVELLPDTGSGSPPSRTIGGALLVKAMTGYQDIETQDELWVTNIGTAGTTVELQIITETYNTGVS